MYNIKNFVALKLKIGYLHWWTDAHPGSGVGGGGGGWGRVPVPQIFFKLVPSFIIPKIVLN